jgi:hypothetical protein
VRDDNSTTISQPLSADELMSLFMFGIDRRQQTGAACSSSWFLIFFKKNSVDANDLEAGSMYEEEQHRQPPDLDPDPDPRHDRKRAGAGDEAPAAKTRARTHHDDDEVVRLSSDEDHASSDGSSKTATTQTSHNE